MPICPYAYVHMCICVYVHMGICAYGHMCIWAYVHMGICAYGHMCICGCRVGSGRWRGLATPLWGQRRTLARAWMGTGQERPPAGRGPGQTRRWGGAPLWRSLNCVPRKRCRPLCWPPNPPTNQLRDCPTAQPASRDPDGYIMPHMMPNNTSYKNPSGIFQMKYFIDRMKNLRIAAHNAILQQYKRN